MRRDEYISIPELAKILGITRIAVYKKVKKGQIKARKIGRNFAVPKKYIMGFVGAEPGEKEKRQIDDAIKKTVREYGEVLKLLGRE